MISMKITGFAVASYRLTFRIDCDEVDIVVPFDRFGYQDIQAEVFRAYRIVLPSMSQEEWADMLQAFVARALREGARLEPVATINRYATSEQ